ncbi:hypothetical protein FA95DRAFT_1606479 [Auriscalpium vulgare]|uniref:Uncharacterized protein n=1 Tax=Auriscalpium vulgare TaxID=40419 RepID=A0ACB8RSA3_9AGAM|nr:hypothetical protein FA95DRAFT_1606479 [Auriscalpium vulgare]
MSSRSVLVDVAAFLILAEHTCIEVLADFWNIIRSRSTSPFRIRRTRTRDPSPTVGALTLSDVESDSEWLQSRPRSAYSVSDDEDSDSDSGDSDDDWSDDQFDPETEVNTGRNALIVPADLPDGGELELADPLGEGVNVVVPPEPYFPTTLTSTSARGPRRRKSTRHNEPLSSRPRAPYTSAIAGGDTMLIVNVMEDEKKTDPSVPNAADRAAKLHSHQERQGLAYILCR